MENKQEKGITILDVIKMFFSKKLLLAIVTVLVAIIIVVGFEFGVNKKAKYYEAEFEYVSKNLNEGFYQSGEVFDGRELIGEKFLESTKASSESFKNISIDNIVESDLTDVVVTKEYKDEKDKKPSKVTFELRLPKSAFTSYDEAKKFMVELVNQPIKKNLEISDNRNYLVNINLFDSSITYERAVGYLESQLNLIYSEYDTILNTYGNYVLSDGSTILEKKNIVESVFAGTEVLKELLVEIKINGYVKGEAGINDLKDKKELLTRDLNLINLKLNDLITQRDNLIASANGLQTIDIKFYNDEIVKLSNKKTEIEFEIAAYDEQINNPIETSSFDKKLDDYKAKLVKFTNEMVSIKKNLIESESDIYFASKSIVSVDGGTNILMIGVLALIFGLLVGGVVNITIDYVGKNKKHLEEQK